MRSSKIEPYSKIYQFDDYLRKPQQSFYSSYFPSHLKVFHRIFLIELTFNRIRKYLIFKIIEGIDEQWLDDQVDHIWAEDRCPIAHYVDPSEIIRINNLSDVGLQDIDT